jgi:hypothetical protein
VILLPQIDLNLIVTPAEPPALVVIQKCEPPDVDLGADCGPPRPRNPKPIVRIKLVSLMESFTPGGTKDPGGSVITNRPSNPNYEIQPQY